MTKREKKIREALSLLCRDYIGDGTDLSTAARLTTAVQTIASTPGALAKLANHIEKLR